VALAAYAARAGLAARVYAPATTPPTILGQIRSFGGDLVLVNGHIGDCGKAARGYARTGALDVSTLREPYRIEGKKTLGLELAEQLRLDHARRDRSIHRWWHGLIGMWKAFAELIRRRLASRKSAPPVQRAGRGVRARRECVRGRSRVLRAMPGPQTIAAACESPLALGDRLMLAPCAKAAVGRWQSRRPLAAAARDLQPSRHDAAPESGGFARGTIELKARGCCARTSGS